MNNMHVLFAIDIGGYGKKSRCAFASIIAFILINRITGSVFGESDMLLDSTATVKSLFGSTLVVSDYFIDILGAPALNIGYICWYN